MSPQDVIGCPEMDERPRKIIFQTNLSWHVQTFLADNYHSVGKQLSETQETFLRVKTSMHSYRKCLPWAYFTEPPILRSQVSDGKLVRQLGYYLREEKK